MKAWQFPLVGYLARPSVYHGTPGMAPPAPMRSKLVSWLIAIRPHTLTMTVAPVLVGTALAWHQAGQIHGLAVAVALLGGLLIQAATNLYNDAADCVLGNDGGDRLGPPRCVASGIFTARQVQRMALLFFFLAALAGLYLVHIGGIPILVLGILSILSGWGYSGGPRPIAYGPFGELFVIVFFGLGAVGGTCWLAGGFIAAETMLAGLAIGAFASAVLLVNNYRDIACDTRAGRRTLSIVAGTAWSKRLYVLFMALPFILLLIIMTMSSTPGLVLGLPFAVLPASFYLCRLFVREPQGMIFNMILKRTAQTQLAYGCLLGVGLVL